MTELLPTESLLRADMTPEFNQSSIFGNSGASTINEHGPAYWRLKVETGFLSLDHARVWSAWLRRRQGARVPFLAYRLWLARPGGTIVTPDGSIGVALVSSGTVVRLSGVGSGASAKAGDMISFRTTNSGYYLGEVTQDAFEAGGVLDLSVQPDPWTPHATPELRRVKALGEFRIINPPDAFEDLTNRRLQFEARQVLR